MISHCETLSEVTKRFLTLERKWVFPFVVAAILSSILLFLTVLITFIDCCPTPLEAMSFGFGNPGGEESRVRETKPGDSSSVALPSPPRFAYLISGSSGDGERLKRTLQSVYHPLNQYVVHLDLESPVGERTSLYSYVRNDSIFNRFKNVHVITKANIITYRGPTMVANTLHAAAILLKKGGEWDWFINLSAADYPLVTQDDLLDAFSYLLRDFNFIHHSSNIRWQVNQRVRPIVVDPGLYSSNKSSVIWVPHKRTLPTAFRLFTGSAWMLLSRAFVEYCVWGWDNLPRKVLLYYANYISSPEGYFHTVICNAHEFRNTTVNTDLHFIEWDRPAKQHPRFLTLDHYQIMINSSVPFARKFRKDDPVLDKIDRELLQRGRRTVTPGGWCVGSRDNGSDPCSLIGDPTILKPGPGSWRLKLLMMDLLSKEKFRPRQCV